MNLILEHIGEINAVGTVQVFGYSAMRIDAHLEQLVYLNYAGPATAADSLWARLVDRKALDFTDLRGRAHRLHVGTHPGLQGNEAPFKRFVTRIEHLATDNYILLDKRFIMADYDADTSLTFVFEGENLADKVGQHISQCTDIAVFPEWHSGLLALGRRARLILPLHNYGGHPVHQVTLDRERWTQVIKLAVEKQELTWPGEESSEAARELLLAPIPEPEPEQPARSAPIHRSWAPPKVEPSTLFLSALMTARAEAMRAGRLAQTKHTGGTMIQIATQLTDLVREHIAYKDFWETPALIEQLQSRLKVLLDDQAVLPYAQLDAVTDRLVALARQHHAGLLPSGQQAGTPELPAAATETAGKGACRDGAHSVGQPASDTSTEPVAQLQVDGVAYTLTHTRNWTWLAFEHKPAEWVLTRLDKAGFKYSGKRTAWYSRTVLGQDYVERLLA